MCCPKCRTENRDDQSRCLACGAELLCPENTETISEAAPESGAGLKKKAGYRRILLLLASLLLLAVLFLLSWILFPYYWPTVLFHRYTDPQAQETAVAGEAQEEQPSSPDPGNWETLLFGRYEQDGILENGPEEIEWIVLSKFGSKQLLLSRSVLDRQRFNRKDRKVTWETCTLREWLNETFLQEAFLPNEQEKILAVNVYANQESWVAKPGRSKEDRVFVLSVAEAEQLFSSDSERICLPSAYAVQQGVFAWNPDLGGGCDWWLRGPDEALPDVPFVSSNGSVHEWGMSVDWDSIGVRPAIWIDPG